MGDVDSNFDRDQLSTEKVSGSLIFILPRPLLRSHAAVTRQIFLRWQMDVLETQRHWNEKGRCFPSGKRLQKNYGTSEHYHL